MKKIKTIKKLIIPACFGGMLMLGSCRPLCSFVGDNKAGFNGGFEFQQSGQPVNWMVYTEETAEEGSFDIVTDSSESQEGKHCLKINVRRCSDKGGRFSPGLAQEVEAAPGDRLRITFWVKNQNSQFSVSARGVNATEGDKGQVIRSDQNYDKWQLIEMDYVMPVGMDKLRFEISVTRPGTFKADGINIQKING